MYTEKLKNVQKNERYTTFFDSFCVNIPYCNDESNGLQDPTLTELSVLRLLYTFWRRVQRDFLTYLMTQELSN